MSQVTANTLLKVLDESVIKFIDSLPVEQKRIYDKVVDLVSQLDRRNGNIKINVANQKLLLKISAELDKIILSDSYQRKVAEFSKVFETVSILNNRYLAATFAEFKPFKTLEEIKRVNMELTIDALTEAKVGVGMKAQIMDVLKANIGSGGSYGDLIRVLHGEIVEGVKGNSPYMISESQKIVIDAVHQYNAQYIKAVTDDLGLEWFQYLGSLLTTSRAFCVHMVEKRYFHVSEIPALLRGEIDGKQIPLSKKGLPVGMFDNTNATNFFIYRGGHKCGHQIIPVPAVVVPKELRDRFN